MIQGRTTSWSEPANLSPTHSSSAHTKRRVCSPSRSRPCTPIALMRPPWLSYNNHRQRCLYCSAWANVFPRRARLYRHIRDPPIFVGLLAQSGTCRYKPTCYRTKPTSVMNCSYVCTHHYPVVYPVASAELHMLRSHYPSYYFSKTRSTHARETI